MFIHISELLLYHESPQVGFTQRDMLAAGRTAQGEPPTTAG